MRLFIGIAIEPNDEIRKVIAETKKLGLRSVSEDNLHINLKFLGEVEGDKIEEIKKALDVAMGFGNFDARLEGVGAFPDSNLIRVIWIGVKSEEIKRLAGIIENELERLGFNKEIHYIPHITLARVPKRTEGLKKLVGEKDFGTQKIKDVHLIKSTLGPNGPTYEKIYSVKL